MGTLNLILTQNPGIIKSQRCQSLFGLLLPPAVLSLTRGDRKLHTAEFIEPRLAASLSAYQGMESVNWVVGKWEQKALAGTA